MVDDSAARQFDRLRPDRIRDVSGLRNWLSRFAADVVRQPTHESVFLTVDSAGNEEVLRGWVPYPATLRSLQRLLEGTPFRTLRVEVEVLPSKTVSVFSETGVLFAETRKRIDGREKPEPGSGITYVWDEKESIRPLFRKGDSWTLCAARCGYLGWVFSEEIVWRMPSSGSAVLPEKGALDESRLFSVLDEWLGVPYVWGGGSRKGIDCSGLSRRIYQDHGVVLPRDAFQQMLGGWLVSTHDNRKPLRTGDLLFFTLEDGRIGHVGISLGGWRMVHAERPRVCICSLREGDPDYNLERAKHFVFAKRCLVGSRRPGPV